MASTFAPYAVSTRRIDLVTGMTSMAVSTFFHAQSVEEFCASVAKQETAVRVRCTQLGIDMEGDYVGVTHSFHAEAA